MRNRSHLAIRNIVGSGEAKGKRFRRRLISPGKQLTGSRFASPSNNNDRYCLFIASSCCWPADREPAGVPNPCGSLTIERSVWRHDILPKVIASTTNDSDICQAEDRRLILLTFIYTDDDAKSLRASIFIKRSIRGIKVQNPKRSTIATIEPRKRSVRS